MKCRQKNAKFTFARNGWKETDFSEAIKNVHSSKIRVIETDTPALTSDMKFKNFQRKCQAINLSFDNKAILGQNRIKVVLLTGYLNKWRIHKL